MLVVFVCYLDDSGKDPQNPITTLAGFVANEDHWAAFEREAATHFTEYCVPILHSKELYHTEGPFEGWSILKKQCFVNRVCRSMSPHVPLGVSMSCLKSTYKQRASESEVRNIVSPYTACFNVIVDWLLRGVTVGRQIHDEGLSFVLESGHENNGEVERQFQSIRKRYGLENVLRTVSLVPKEHCRAIQVADLIAFYSRRHTAAIHKAKATGHVKPGYDPVFSMLQIIQANVPVRSFVATDLEIHPDQATSRDHLLCASSREGVRQSGDSGNTGDRLSCPAEFSGVRRQVVVSQRN